MSTTIVGASAWEQNIYEHLVHHVESERAAIAAYSEAAARSSSPAFTYLASAILDDEQRHHRVMGDLAASIRRFAELQGEPEPIPPLDRPTDAAALLAVTEKMLAVEKQDRKELSRLRKELDDLGDTTLWQLVVTTLEIDTEKHNKMLEFARTWLANAAKANR